MTPPELTKDWSYERESHMKYLNDLCKEEPYSVTIVRNETLAKSTIPSLRKRYRHSYNKDLFVKLCIDNTIDDEMFPGRNYWADLMLYVEEDAEIPRVLDLLKTMGMDLPEDSIYYNSATCTFFVTLNRTRDDNGPNLYEKERTTYR